MLCAVMKVTPYMRTGVWGRSDSVSWNLTSLGTVRSWPVSGRPSNSQSSNGKLAKPVESRNAPGSLMATQRRNDSCVEWRWPPEKAPQQ
jgi:hypothetical protein